MTKEGKILKTYELHILHCESRSFLIFIIYDSCLIEKEQKIIVTGCNIHSTQYITTKNKNSRKNKYMCNAKISAAVNNLCAITN